MPTKISQKIYRCCLRAVSPLHIGCDEDYEPTGFIVNEKVPQLIAVAPLALIRSLSSEKLQRLTQICAQGSVSSLIEVYKLLRDVQIVGRGVDVCSGFIGHYKKTLGISSRDEKRVQQELNRFAIPRTAFRTSDGRPYIPGSSIKGALRTAYLNLMENEKKLSQKKPYSDSNRLQYDLLNYTGIPDDPFRMVKVSDFNPVGNAQTRIVYAVNEKKTPSERKPRGLPLLMEVIKPGTLFVGQISVDSPLDGAGIRSPITLENLLKGASSFYANEKNRETKELTNIGVAPRQEQRSGDAWWLRCGRHSGAECVTVNGHRSISILGKRGERKISNHATTLWLASEHPRPKSKEGLFPLGWAEVMPLGEKEAEQLEAAENDFRKTDAISGKPVSVAIAAKADIVLKDALGKNEPQKTKKIEPTKEIWKAAYLTWEAGSGTLTASDGKRKAVTRMREIIPEGIAAELLKKGKKKRITTADVTVEPIGSFFKIVAIKG